MEYGVNILVAALLFGTWAALTAVDPVAVSEPKSISSTRLVFLEDALAHDRASLGLAEQLAGAYLEMGMPALAIGVLRDAAIDLSDSPLAVHRLAEAYEATGRMEDALATSERALTRCGRSLGLDPATNVGPRPARGCEMRDYIAFEMHRSALARMVQWGVASSDDTRVQLAYEMARRRASIALAY